jgi:hypothetical protein
VRKLIQSPALLAFLALPAIASAQLSMSMQMGKPDTPIVGLPFSADQSIRTIQHLANGMSLTNEIKGHVYRSAEGVERYDGAVIPTAANPDPTLQVLILDRVKHTSITLNSKLKIAMLRHLPDNAAVSVSFLPQQQPTFQNKAIKPENLTTTDLGKKTEGMLSLVGKRVTGTIPAGAMGNDQPLLVTTEAWYAPSLKLIVHQIEQNPLSGERTFELTNIRGDQPDPALFQIPDGYTIKEPPPMPTYPAVAGFATKAPEQPTRQIEDALNNPDPIIRNKAVAAEDARNADIASGYATDLAGAGDAGASRLSASRAAAAAETAAAAAETAAATVESDASRATAASSAHDRAAVRNARKKAASDYSALLAADNQLAKAATDLVAAAQGNAAFYSASPGNAAINDIGTQDSSAAANLLSAATKGGIAGYTAAAANQATAIKDANIIAGLDSTRTLAFQAAAKAETEAQSAAAAAAAAGEKAAAASAEAAAATAGATADGPGNPYAGAVEIGAAAVANAASATISAQHAMDSLKALK